MKVKMAKVKTLYPAIVPLDKCIAKRDKAGDFPGMTTEEHCLDVAYVAEALYNDRRFCPAAKMHVIADFILWAALHDVGKVCPGFLKRIYRDKELMSLCRKLYDDTREFEYLHATVSEAALRDIFKGKINCGSKCELEAWHHGIRDHEPSDANGLTYGGPAYQKTRKKLVRRLMRILNVEFHDARMSEIQKDMTLGLICLSDWIASNENNFKPTGGFTPEENRMQARKVVGLMDWFRPTYKDGLSFGDCFKNRKGNPYRPNEMQKKMESLWNQGKIQRGGVYIIEESTGGGKTEAALRMYYLMAKAGLVDGLYYGLPTRFTSNNMHRRVVDFLERVVAEGSNPRLIHGEAWMLDEIKSSSQLSPGGHFFDTNRRAVIEPFGVGTVDQALLAAIRSKFYFVRQFGLAGKMVILDEVHSYDIYTSTLMTELIRKLVELNCTVFILSATLTSKAKSMLLGYGQKNLPSTCRCAGYPRLTMKIGKEITTRSLGKGPRRVVIIKHVYDRERVVRDVVDLYEKGYSIVWIENIVGESVMWFNACAAEMRRRGLTIAKPTGTTALPSGVIPIGLLHSTLRRPRRSDVEEKWTDQLGKDNSARPFGSILFATQVVEQSLDIDCDIMVTNMAPSDFLIQRGGRCGRHIGRRGQRGLNRPSGWKKPEIWIITPYALKTRKEEEFREALDKSGLVYDPYTMWRTYQTWKGVKSITCPRDVRKILAKTYRRPVSGDPKWVRKWWKDSEIRREKKYQKALLSVASHEAFNDEAEENLPFNREWTLMPESGGMTRLQEVPTVQIVLCQSVSVYRDRMEMILYDGHKITMHDNRRRYSPKDVRTIRDNMVKVPRTKSLNDNDDDLKNPKDRTKVFLKNAVFGHPMAVVVSGDKIHRCDSGGRMGEMTDYNFDDEHGAYRRGYIQ